MNSTLSKILVVRNDKLGDFMLAYPTFALLKTALPNAEIHALVPEYTEPMAEACEYIDHVVLDPGKNKGLSEQINLIKKLKSHRYDAVITLFSTTRIGICLLLADIPYRLAPATKIAQIFYNKKLAQHRSQSAKPEFAYNLDLAEYMLREYSTKIPRLPEPPFLHFPDNQIQQLRAEFCRLHAIEPERLLLFIHPGSGGSANNLSPDQFATISRNLTSRSSHTIVISTGPDDEAIATSVSESLPDTPHIVYKSDQGLRRFAEHIQFADLFISGSTGPLHIAGALNRPTAGFYTKRKSATALRWQTLNSEPSRLTFSPPENAEREDMNSIDLMTAAEKISQTFLM
jgi:ADP-heptose:LPS heptosyltransferase